LGDKSAHQATINLPQLFYFSLICAAFTPALFLKFSKQFISILHENKISVIVGLFCLGTVVQFNTMAHPYLLADNRHYAFYAWKILTKTPVIKYLLVPVYLFCLVCIIDSLKERGVFFQMACVSCVVASLVPQLLLEPRYFIIPYIMFRLHIPLQSATSNILNLCVAIFVNLATVYMYEYCPFAKSVKVHFIW
jgi:alpha-1,2-glucosyltransferase